MTLALRWKSAMNQGRHEKDSPFPAACHNIQREERERGRGDMNDDWSWIYCKGP